MVKFNLHFGQHRPTPQGLVSVVGDGNATDIPTNVGYARRSRESTYYRPKPPIGRIQLMPLKGTAEACEYKADALGNIEVVYGPHLEALAGMGWPIYDGDGAPPVKPDDLIWPRPDLSDDPYLRRINEELHRRVD